MRAAQHYLPPEEMHLPFHIESPRLVLRPFRDSDLEPFLAYRNDPDVARYQSWDVPYAREKGVDFIEAMKTASPISPAEWYQVAVELKSTRELIGDVAFCTREFDEAQAFVGYSFARPHWHHGYAYEALRSLLKYLFEDRNLHRVIAECDVENSASWALLEKMGFRREAHLRESIFFKGAYGSEYHYAMLRREWAQHEKREQVD